MKRIILAAVAALSTLVAVAPAEAQRYRDGYRDHRQEQRIRSGYYSGRLTGREAYRLQRQQHRIDRYRWASRRDDGRLSRHERARLHHMRNNASRSIYRQKHDWQGRRYGYNRW